MLYYIMDVYARLRKFTYFIENLSKIIFPARWVKQMLVISFQ